MNEQLVLDMAKPFVKDGCLTYEQFDVIYDMLSRREQYQVVEILFCHDIELIDEEAVDDEEILELEEDESEEQADQEPYIHYTGCSTPPVALLNAAGRAAQRRRSRCSIRPVAVLVLGRNTHPAIQSSRGC